MLPKWSAPALLMTQMKTEGDAGSTVQVVTFPHAHLPSSLTKWQSAASLEALAWAVLCCVARLLWHNLTTCLNWNGVLCVVGQVVDHCFRLPIHDILEVVLHLRRCCSRLMRTHVHVLFSCIWVPAVTNSYDLTISNFTKMGSCSKEQISLRSSFISYGRVFS